MAVNLEQEVKRLEQVVSEQAIQIHKLKQDKQNMRLQPEQLARAIMNHCNTFDRSGDWVLIKEMLNEHRTIQQTMFQLVIRIVIEMASASYDGRNQAAVACALKLREYMEQEQMIFKRGEDETKYDIYLPCI